MKNTAKVGFVSLGCPKNQLDTEIMLRELYDEGFEIVAEDIEVSGMVGIQSVSHIAWADDTTHQAFHLYSEDVSGEELLKVAQSVVRND